MNKLNNMVLFSVTAVEVKKN